MTRFLTIFTSIYTFPPSFFPGLVSLVACFMSPFFIRIAEFFFPVPFFVGTLVMNKMITAISFVEHVPCVAPAVTNLRSYLPFCVSLSLVSVLKVNTASFNLIITIAIFVCRVHAAFLVSCIRLFPILFSNNFGFLFVFLAISSVMVPGAFAYRSVSIVAPFFFPPTSRVAAFVVAPRLTITLVIRLSMLVDRIPMPLLTPLSSLVLPFLDTPFILVSLPWLLYIFFLWLLEPLLLPVHTGLVSILFTTGRIIANKVGLIGGRVLCSEPFVNPFIGSKFILNCQSP